MRKSEILLFAFLFLFLSAFPAFSSDPNFTVVIQRSGFSSPNLLTANQSNVSMRFVFTNLLSDGGFIVRAEIDLSNLNSAGQILSGPGFEPVCPSGLSLPSIVNQRTLQCVPAPWIPESGIATGTNFNIDLYFNRIQDASADRQVFATLLDEEDNSTMKAIDFTIQNKPSLISTIPTEFPTNVSKGQRNVPIKFMVKNDVASPASPVGLLSYVTRIEDSAGNLSNPASVVQTPSGAVNLSSQSTVNYTFYVDIPLNASTGTLTQKFNLSAVDPNSGYTFYSTQVQDSTQVLSPPNLTFIAMFNSTPFISATYPNNTANITLRVNNTGQASANVTGIAFSFSDYQGIDVSGNFVYANTTQINRSVPMHAARDFSFNVTGIGSWPGGNVTINYTVYYVDAGSDVSYGPLQGGKTGAFSYDTVPPTISITGLNAITSYFVRPTGNVQINSTVSDSLSGIASNCAVLFGNNNTRTLTDLTYNVAGTCNGTVVSPAGPSLFGELPLKVVATDRVGNNATASYSVFLYTLQVPTLDAMNGEEIKNTSTLSNAIVSATNVSGNGVWQCLAMTGYNDSNHACGIPYGTVVNLSAYSPAYVWNNSAGNQTVCVGGSGDIYNCDTSTPSGGRVISIVRLLPNTVIRLFDEFGLAVEGFNITVSDSLSWFTYLSDQGSGDENLSIGEIMVPLDTGKHQVPFTISFNSPPNYNNTGLSPWNFTFSPTNTSQTIINKTTNFSAKFYLFDEFGNEINRTGGSVVYNQEGRYGFSGVACISKPGDNHIYGCRIPTATEIANASYGILGANFSISKPGFVNFNTSRMVPPATPASPPASANASIKFSILIIPRDEWNLTTLDYAKISSVSSEFAGECYRNGTLSVWGCPSTESDSYINVTTANSSGYLLRNITVSPSLLVQKTNYSQHNYTLSVSAYGELLAPLGSSQISSIVFNSTHSCVNNPGGNVWGCPVPVQSGTGQATGTALASSGYLNCQSPNVTIPLNVSGPRALVNCTLNYTVRANTTNEFSQLVSIAGSNVTAHLSNGTTVACSNSSYSSWFCPVPAGTSATIVSKVPNYISSNKTASASSVSGSQTALLTENPFTVLVYTRDELGNLPDLRSNGSVNFSGTVCVNNSVSAFLWGCPAIWSSSGNASITFPGIISWNSTEYLVGDENGPQVSIYPSLQYTLLVNLTDQVGNPLSFATVSASGTILPCRENQSKHYCPIYTPTSTVTVYKSGFANRTAIAGGMSSSGPQRVLQLTRANSSGILYSASIRVTREINDSSAEMSQGVSFLNKTTGSLIAPFAQDPLTPNIFLFAFPDGNQDIIVRKSGYVDSRLSFSTSSSPVPYDNANTAHKFALKLGLFSENGTGITGGATLSPYTHHRNGTTPYYYFALSEGLATITGGKVGYVNNSTSAQINTTYPAGQAEANLTLPFTLKLSSFDWSGLALNGTTVNVTYAVNGSLISSTTLSGTQNTAYFPLSHLTPEIAISVSRDEYNTVGFNSTSLSQSIQTALNTSHAQNIITAVTDWGGAPIQSATVRLYKNSFGASEKIASCTTNASGICKIISTNLASDPDTIFFNSSRVSSGDILMASIEKPGFGTVQTSGETYYCQNSSSPLVSGTFLIGGRITFTARQSWGAQSPIAGATIFFRNSSGTQIAIATTNSSGSASFSPNYYASASPSDAYLSFAEIANLAPYTGLFQKAGYSNQTNGSTFNSSSPETRTFTGYDNAAPVFTFYWPDGSVYDGSESTPYNGTSLGLEDIEINFSVSDPYGTDGSGLNYSRLNVSILNSTGFAFEAKSPACQGGNCTSNFSGWKIPSDGNLTLRIAAYDNSSNLNESLSLIISIPVVNVTGTEFLRASAFSNGLDYWNFSFNLSVKGDYAKMRLSDFTGISSGYLNLTGSGCSGSSCASMWYYNASSCSAESVPVYNDFNASVVPYPFCDRNSSSTYLREHTVFLVVMVPPSIPADRYNATYGFMGGKSS